MRLEAAPPEGRRDVRRSGPVAEGQDGDVPGSEGEGSVMEERGDGGGGFAKGVFAEGMEFQGVNYKLNFQFTPFFPSGRGGMERVFLENGRHGDRPAKLRRGKTILKARKHDGQQCGGR